MNATEAKSLLIDIPKEEFLTNVFTDRVGKCCAIGHLVRKRSRNPKDYTQQLSDYHDNTVYDFARVAVRKFTYAKHREDANLATINNSRQVNGYTEINPKDRVMHLLDDMIEAGY